MSYASGLASIKETLGVFRELAIIVAVAVVVFRPGVVVLWAKAFNDEGKRLGAKSSELRLGPATLAFDNSADQVATLTAATKANEDVQKLAQQLSATAASPQNVARARQIEQTANTVAAKLAASISATKTTLLAQDQAIQAAAGVTSGAGDYGIVVSADKQDDLAAYEVQQLHKRAVSDVKIFDRQGFLRTVAAFANRDDAEKELPAIEQYRKSAYVINLSKWCPNPQNSGRQIAGAAVLLCK